MESYIEKAFSELYNEDGLTIMGKGLGIELLYAKFIQYYSLQRCGAIENVDDITPISYRPRRLVFCINASEIEDSLRELLLSEGVSLLDMPQTINNEVNSTERPQLYKEGGCFFITSRILIVDLLDNKLDAKKISGVLVYNAHKISETSIDSFVIRVFRERNRTGFLKAFSDDAEYLASNSGRTERILRTLYLRKVYLWPRFRLEVTQALEGESGIQVPEVIEMNLLLTRHMQVIQSAILVAMNTTINELKKSLANNSHINLHCNGASNSDGSSGIDTSQWTLENGLFHNFDYIIRQQLDVDWHKITSKNKQLLNDLSVLRKLLDYLVRYDALSFYFLLKKLQQSTTQNLASSSLHGNTHSSSSAANSSIYSALWIFSTAADEIFKHAKERVYSLKDISAADISGEYWKKSFPPMLLPMVQLCLKELRATHVLEPVVEYPPKWKVVDEVMREIRVDFFHRFNGSARHASNRVLFVVRDELALAQLRDVVLLGADAVMEQRFRWFVSQECAKIRRKVFRQHSHSHPVGKSSSGKSGKASGDKPVAASSSGSGGGGGGDGDFLLKEHEVNQLLLEELEQASSGAGGIGAGLDGEDCDDPLALADADIMGEEDVSTRMFQRSMEADSMGSGSAGGRVNFTAMQRLRGYLGLLLTREQTHSLSEEQRLLLLQEKILKLTQVQVQQREQQQQPQPQQQQQQSEQRSSKKATKAVAQLKSRKRFPRASSSSSSNKRAKVTESNRGDLVVEEHGAEGEEAEEGFEYELSVACSSRPAELEVLFLTHDQLKEERLAALQDMDPQYIVLYDADVAIVRKIEAFQSRRHTSTSADDTAAAAVDLTAESDEQDPVKVYFLVYEGSTEQHRYTAALVREKKAFESLISTKEHLVVSLPDHPEDIYRAFLQSLAGGGSGDSRAQPTPLPPSSGAGLLKLRKIIVDVREFRCSLPTALHSTATSLQLNTINTSMGLGNSSAAYYSNHHTGGSSTSSSSGYFHGFQLVPRTLYVADYVLSPEICVERKGISDLFQSFASGRLYNQCEHMMRYYKYPCLLIEFHQEKAFMLLNINEISTDIQPHSITSKLVLLAHAFPQLRLLWSRSAQHTSDIFRSLVLHHEEVDEHKAVSVGAVLDGSNGSTEDASMYGRGTSAADGAYNNSLELLLSLPGINVHNFRSVMKHVNSIAELSRCNESQLSPLIGPSNAKKLVAFFKQRISN